MLFLKRAKYYTVGMGSLGLRVNKMPYHQAFLYLYSPRMVKMRTLKQVEITKHFLNSQREM